MKHAFWILPALALTVAACSGSNSTPTLTTAPAPTVTDTFTGTVPVGGVDFKPFIVAQSGTLSVTLTTAGPPPTIFMGLGLGTPSSTTCAVITGDSTITPAGTTAQLTGTVAAGTYCIQVSDVGNAVSPITYSVTVAHT